MAKLAPPIKGVASGERLFLKLLCPVDCELTRHTQRRVLAHWPSHWKAEWHILVRCSKCKLEYIFYTDKIPEGLQLYHIRVYAQGRMIPELGKELSTMEEVFLVLASSRQDAYRQALFSSSIPTSGQLVETFINGEVERDERY